MATTRQDEKITETDSKARESLEIDTARTPRDQNGDSANSLRHSSSRERTNLRSLFVGSNEAIAARFNDSSLKNLSHVGRKVVSALIRKHFLKYETCWNVSKGQVVSLDPTPRQAFESVPGLPDLQSPDHSSWYPTKLQSVLERTEVWCDILSLTPPDGDFLTAFQQAFETLHAKDQPIVIRIMFGHVVGMAVNCRTVLKKLTVRVPETTKLLFWLGAWRRNVSWNHSKIIAVDGTYLVTGGHNWWHRHLLCSSPALDVSIELKGACTIDAHRYAQRQWTFCERNKKYGSIACLQTCLNRFSIQTYVDIKRFPKGIPSFPPTYQVSTPYFSRFLRGPHQNTSTTDAPIISCGRYGKMSPLMTGSLRRRPSDDALLAMFESATKSIRIVCQDIGPVCFPKTKIALPGYTWPKDILNALGRVLWKKDVVLEIVVSNAFSVPDNLSPLDANYGNGWNAVDVAAEIIKTIRKFRGADDRSLREKVVRQLRVTRLRTKFGRKWPDGMSAGLHSKHYIVDDCACYIGSQNLYVCDLAEYGVLIDDKTQTKQIMDEYWYPLWRASYCVDDCNVDDVMDGLKIDRDGENPKNVSAETRRLMQRTDSQYGRTLAELTAGTKVPADLSDYVPSDLESY